MKTIKLRNGEEMPSIGIGTYRMRDEQNLYEVLDKGLSIGYRLIDTASVYGNEAFIGNALKCLLPKYSLKREDIFITSKLHPKHQGNGAGECVQKSLRELGTDYLDLYLIHWPGTSKLSPQDPANAHNRRTSWATLTQLHDSGTLRGMGVSNYEERHLAEMETQSPVVPVLNQCEHHPHFNNSALKDACAARRIHFQCSCEDNLAAYASLGSHTAAGSLLQEETVVRIAAKMEKTPAQILLTWALNQGLGCSVLPRTTKPERLAENLEARNIELNAEDMASLSKLDRRQKYCWDPVSVA